MNHNNLSRRIVLAGLAVGISGGARSSGSRATLGGLGSVRGIEIGSAIRATDLSDPMLTALVAQQCRTITPELEMKWGALAPSAGARDHAAADAIAEFARDRGLRLRGHALLWHRSIPEWAIARMSEGAGWGPVGDHIDATVARYRMLVDEWDVLNEPIADDGALRPSPLLTAFGTDYVARALDQAHAAAPRARLAINEYGLEYDRPDHAARRAGLLALARSLVRRGAALHRIGIQAHLDLSYGALASVGLRNFIDAVVDLGLGVSITELDVKEVDLLLPAAERDRRVADHVAAFLDIALAKPAVRSLSCWGLSDRRSWLAITDADRARFPGAWADGSSPGLNRGLPYDASGRPKPMRAAIAAALGRR